METMMRGGRVVWPNHFYINEVRSNPFQLIKMNMIVSLNHFVCRYICGLMVDEFLRFVFPVENSTFSIGKCLVFYWKSSSYVVENANFSTV